MTKVSQWIKLLGGSLLVAVGFFFLFEAFASMEIWNFYQKFPGQSYHDLDTLLHIPAKGELPFLDHVPILVILGIPLLIVGSAFTIKGMKEYLKEQ
jgi:hypothetical protein